jgi:2-keto-3-deoxy-L-fuconate dehydrogenase
MRFDGAAVVITGGSSGIGLALVKEFLERGCFVWSLSIDPTPQSHERLVSIECDVRDSKAIAEALSNVNRPIDLLVNNAGVMSRGGIYDTIETDYDLLFDINVKGSWLMTKATLPKLAASAHILFVSSRHALSLPDNPALYGLSKKTVLHLAELTQRAYPQHRIKVLCPGPVDTPLARVGVTAEEWERKRRMMCSPQEMSLKIIELLETDDKSRLIFDMETSQHYLE